MRILRDVTAIVVLLLAALVAALPLGCASDPWSEVVAADSASVYRSFLLEHPDSKHAAEAEARIAFHKLMRDPSLEGYVEFRRDHPESELYLELRPAVEPRAFERARFAGTAEAYGEFLEIFPDGALAARARGNRAFLEAGGFTADAPGLGAFAAAYPESDYAPEARRSFETFTLRNANRFHRVGLVIRVSRETPEVGRLEEAFAKRAADQYTAAGIELVPVPESPAAGSAVDLPVARLSIEHSELLDESKALGSGSSQPRMLAVTRVSLRRDDQSPPIWTREFTLRLGAADLPPNQSMLFTQQATAWWSDFFVPVATWRSDLALRDPIASESSAIDVDAVGDRVVLLFEGGDFRVLELTDPAEPLVLAEYTHSDDRTRWQGVRVHGNRVYLFGDDGLEVVRFGGRGPEREALQERPDYGTVLAVEPVGDGLLLATHRGLFLSDRLGADEQRLVSFELRGMALVDRTVVFTDHKAVYVTSLALLKRNRVSGKLNLGREFAPGRVLAFGSDVAVLGEGGALLIDLQNPEKPRVRSRLATADVGRISDVARVGGRFFLLGDRGLQLLDRSGERVVESVDVTSRDRAVRMGRHLVTIGPEGAQLVDGTPFTAPEPTPAAPTP
ncbi:MAG: hypothetical protein JRG96_07370 [Deltaproteobacteria bacterium]|nr:hypothetical protein [Deltaproteobacteria bacterium]